MGEIDIVVRVGAGRRLAPACRALLRRLASATGRRRAGVTLLLGSDAALRRLNRRFRGKDRATDVLSFPAAGDLEPGRPHLGEIAISVPRAARQARRARWRLHDEMALLVTHGYLHLLGHDHETDGGAMRRLEGDLLRRAAGIALDRRRLPWGEAEPRTGPARPRRAGGGRRRLE
jgi:probable rRNA maturation factor